MQITLLPASFTWGFSAGRPGSPRPSTSILIIFLLVIKTKKGPSPRGKGQPTSLSKPSRANCQYINKKLLIGVLVFFDDNYF